MAFKALIFDLDGTLWDSYPCYAAALDCVSERPNGKVLELLRNGENIMSLARRAGVSNSKLSRLCLENVSCLKLYPGVADGLEQLKKKGLALGIATNLPGWFVQPFLSHFGMNSLFVASAFFAQKPSPTKLGYVVRALGKSNPDTLFIGDSESDAKAANAAEISFGWAAYGYFSTPPSGDYTRIVKFTDVLHL
jgi:phosphoglycolate phosphatase